MVYYKLVKKVIKILEDGESYSQKEITLKIGSINRAILTGYLRCLVDLEKIKSKNIGKAKSYSLIKNGVKK